jgi:hypothetical protein
MTDVRATGVLGSFTELEKLVAAIKTLKARDLNVAEVYSPIPSEELAPLTLPSHSPVRFVTFLAGVAGLASGLALALWSSDVWRMVVGAKPVDSIVPFLVVGFELTILFGGVLTLAALLFFGGLPFRRYPAKTFRPEFAEAQFGVVVLCDRDRNYEAADILRQAGALAVEDFGGEQEAP